MDRFTIKCTTVNEPKWSSYIISPDWLKCKNSKINPKNIDDRCFKCAFKLAQHYNDIKIILSEN